MSKSEVLRKDLESKSILKVGGAFDAMSAKLVERIGAKVAGIAFIIELTDLNGIKEINNYKTVSLVQY